MDSIKPVAANLLSVPPSAEPPIAATIGQIQGSGARSPFEGKQVVTSGVVTSLRKNGFYMQAAKAEPSDGSRGLWVFTGEAPTVGVGDRVQVTGKVSEFKGKNANDLSVTNIDARSGVSVIEKKLDLDTILGTPRHVGSGGLTPPTTKAVEGIKFYEALEGERVTVRDLVVVSPTNRGTFYGVTDGGALATTMTSRGTLIKAASDDAQPEAIAIRFADSLLTPALNVGDRINGQVSGIMTYQRGRYVLEVDSLPPVAKTEIPKFALGLKATETQMLCASINCENLDPTDSPERFTNLGTKIVDEYGAPDVVCLQEIQDNDGPADTGTTSASETGRLLCEAIRKAGGPSYVYIDRAPENNKDGGEPGGNIRCGMLVRTDRVTVDDANVRRLGEGDPAFTDTRKPLIVPLTFKATGRSVNFVVVHNSSKRGTQGLWGENQPPVDPTESARKSQLAVIHKFLLDNGGIAVGDYNQEPVESIAQTPVSVRSRVQFVTHEQPVTAPRSYIFDASAQNIDQIQASTDMKIKVEVDATNAMLADTDKRRDSDHGHVMFTVDMAPPKRLRTMRARLRAANAQL